MSASHVSNSATPALQVGDRVRFRLVGRTMTGVIVEDRGPIGSRGAHLFVVQVAAEPSDVRTFELPARELDKVG